MVDRAVDASAIGRQVDAPASFLESPNFPVDLVNRASAAEKKGGGRPPRWEMVFWWTRKPMASARAIIAAALLPPDTDPKRFAAALRLTKNVPHRYNPANPRNRGGTSKARGRQAGYHSLMPLWWWPQPGGSAQC